MEKIPVVKRGALNRDVTKKECSWLRKDLKKGKVVYQYLNYTYNCIGNGGQAVSDEPNETPFYQVPREAVTWET